MTGAPDSDVVVVGAGIVGLATARALARSTPRLTVTVLEKEDAPARHQSGRNSGVVHAGLYYRPDSDKARMVAAGRRALRAFATEHAIPFEACGKVVVATRAAELPALLELQRRGAAHDVEATLVDRRRLSELEPHADGLAALHVPSTAVVDYPAVCRALLAEVEDAGGQLVTGTELTAVRTGPDRVHLETASGGATSTITARTLVTCGGLHADRLARMAGTAPADLRIVPFRGEYHELVPHRAHLVRHLIYPVPDPRFPFLGVHLTRGIDGTVHAGPNAVLALAREGYRWTDVDPAEVRGQASFAGLRRLALRHGRTGALEVARSLDRRALASALRRLVPEVRADDLTPAPAGVRAQAVRSDGTLLDDFAFGEAPRVVSVLNAPSPAATASLEIGRVVAERVRSHLDGS